MAGRLAALLTTLVLLTSCSIERAHVAAEAQHSMVGMSKEQVLACMGPPAQQQAMGETEVWAYPSGGEDHSFGSATAFSSGTATYGYGYGTAYGSGTAFGSSSTIHRYCVVDVVMSNGRVSAVNYQGRTGGLLTEGEQCAFAVQNCAAQHSEAVPQPPAAALAAPAPVAYSSSSPPQQLTTGAEFDRTIPDGPAIHAAYDLMEAGNYSAAMQQFRTYSDRGNPVAMVFVAALYADGHGVDRDCSTARSWVVRAHDAIPTWSASDQAKQLAYTVVGGAEGQMATRCTRSAAGVVPAAASTGSGGLVTEDRTSSWIARYQPFKERCLKDQGDRGATAEQAAKTCTCAIREIVSRSTDRQLELVLIGSHMPVPGAAPPIEEEKVAAAQHMRALTAPVEQACPGRN